MKKYELNRKQYDRIRKMDHNDMKEYLNAVYENGYRSGERAVSEKAAEVRIWLVWRKKCRISVVSEEQRQERYVRL